MMRYYYLFLKEGIVSSILDTHAEIDDPNAIRVYDDPEQYLYKKYINNSWVQASLTKYGTLDENNIIQSIHMTYFISNVPSDKVILPSEAQIGLKFENGELITPEEIL